MSLSAQNANASDATRAAATSAKADVPAAQTGSFLSLLLAILIGLAGVGLITAVVHWYETMVINSGPQINLTAGAPMAAFMMLVLVLALNPLLRKFVPWLGLARRELLIILSMWLLASAVISTYMLGTMLHAAGDAKNTAFQKVTTKRMQLDTLLKPGLFLKQDQAEVYNDGLGEEAAGGMGPTHVPPSRVPWRAWVGPLGFWIPLLIVAVIFVTALAQMVHRQWSRHELLTYPLATFTESFIDVQPGRALPEVFYDKVFWGGFLLMAFIFSFNGLAKWFPLMVTIPLDYYEVDLLREFPFLSKYCGGEAYSLFRGWMYPWVIALAVFLPTEISFTCWAGWVIMVVLLGVHFLVTGEVVGPTDISALQLGMYLAMLAAIVVIGRKEYWAILKHAATFRRAEEATLRAAVRACRLFVAAFAALVFLLTWGGLYWFVALVTAMCFTLVVVLIARMTAEIGIPWLVSFSGVATGLPAKLLGAAALGPQGLAFMAVVAAALNTDTGNSVAAQQMSLLKMEEKQSRGLPRWGFNLILLLGLCAAVATSVGATLWDNYSFGARKETASRARMVDNMELAALSINRLKIENGAKDLKNAEFYRRADTSALPFGERLSATVAQVRPEAKFWRYVFWGAVVVGGCAAMRLRFTWWPFHPLPLLLINTWCLSRLYLSFFIAWVIKCALLRVGGGKFFTRSKPFFIGIIVGQLAITVLWIIVGIVYYLLKGVPPQPVPPLI